MFRIAFANQLLPSVEQWLAYADARVETSHNYSGEKVQATINIARAFAGDAAALYQKMTGKPWT